MKSRLLLLTNRLKFCDISCVSCCRIASIKQTLGEYSEAVDEYKTILAQEHDYVPALKGSGQMG